MAEPPVETQAGSDRFSLLYRLTSSFNSTLDLEEVLNRVIDEIIAATHAERGFVMLREPDGEFTFRVARGLDQQTILDPRLKVSISVVHKVLAEGTPILTSDAQDDSRFNLQQSIISLGLRSILCVPLAVKAKPFGVVYVDNRLQKGIFTQADLQLLSAIAANAAIAIENARLYQVAVEKGRMERELQIAHQMQLSLLPKEIPHPTGWEFSARWQPARQVAGDYYDFLPLADYRLGLLIADVADKGVPASFFMAISRTILRTCARQGASPVETISTANRLICAESTSGYFITLFYAQLDLLTGDLTYVNAGHPPPMLLQDPAAPAVELLGRTGIPLGIDESWEYTQHETVLEPGSLLVAYTDGINEAMNAHQEEFGIERLKMLVAEQGSGSADGMAAAILQSVTNWVGPSEQLDDITLLLARRG
jgi:sigma-B regulation protein RsbU (phosphoserine phosphatase)